MPGEKISWDQHTHAVGAESHGRFEIGLWFYKKGGAEEAQLPDRPSRHRRTKMLDIRRLDGNDRGVHRPQGEHADRNSSALHLRGKRAGRGDSPDGSRQILSYVGTSTSTDDQYIYATTRRAAAEGTVIHVSAWYDNTKANRTTRLGSVVGYGDRTVDEMAHAWMNVVYFTTRIQGAAGRAQAKLAKTTTTTRSSSEPIRTLCAAGLLAGGVLCQINLRRSVAARGAETA